MNISVKIFFFCTLAFAAFAQQQRSSWQWINPSPTGNGLNDVTYATPDTVWAVGDGGTILFSNDSGKTWENRESPVASSLRKVQFVTPRYGWIVGDGGVILATKNYGRTWCSQESATATALHGLSFTDENHGWICGDGSTILKTSNGGKEWTSQTVSPSTLSLKDINFVDSLHGWVCSPDFSVFATDDGGLTWGLLFSVAVSQGVNKTTIKFIDTLHGFFSPGNLEGYFYSTVNGGGSWQKSPQEYIWINALKVFDENTIVGIGEPYFFRSTNAGQSFSAIDAPGGFMSSHRGLDFIDMNNGVYAGSGISTTTDSGHTWVQRLKDFSSGQSFQSVFFVDSSYGWICGDGGSMFHTTDRGKSWIKQSIATTNQLNAVHFTSDSVGWTCGNSSSATDPPVFFKTGDGGAHWIPITPAYQGQLTMQGNAKDIQFTNKNRGVTIADVNSFSTSSAVRVLRTTDGGQTWLVPRVSPASDYVNVLKALYMLDDMTGWILGGTAKIYATTDGGDTWLSLNNFPQTRGTLTILPTDVFFANKNIGWVVGNGFLLTTTDAGSHWMYQDSTEMAGYFFNTVHFVNKDTGWVVGSTNTVYDQFIFYTNNGGITWTKEVLPLPPGYGGTGGLQNIFHSSAKDVFVVGVKGIILHSTNSGLPYFVNVEGEMGALPQEINFGGCRTINANHDTTISLTNIISCGALNVTSIKCLVDTVFHVLSSSPYHLAGDSTIKITLRYHPKGLGQHVDTLVITSDGYVPEQRVVLVGGAGVANVGSLPDIIDFGVQTINSTHDIILSIPNAGCADLVIDTIMFSGNNNYIVSRTQLTIHSNASDTVTVRFTPTRGDCPYLDTLSITSNGIDHIRRVPFTGKINQGMFTDVPKEINFSERPVNSINDTSFTIHNTQCATLIDSLWLFDGTNFTVLSPDLANAPFTLLPGASQKITIEYSAVRKGTYFDTLYVSTDGLDTLTKILLEGSDTATVDVNSTTNNSATAFSLEQNHPNPFSQLSVISYQLSGERHQGTFEVRDMLGRIVYHTSVFSYATHGSREFIPCAGFTITIDASELANGMYLYSLTDGAHMQTKMMMVVK